MPRLAARVGDTLDRIPRAHAFLLRRHGLYTWGDTLADAERHVEILEFLFEAIGRTTDAHVEDREYNGAAPVSADSMAGRSVMALVRIPRGEHARSTDAAAIRAYLAGRGIDYERWIAGDRPSRPDAPAEARPRGLRAARSTS